MQVLKIYVASKNKTCLSFRHRAILQGKVSKGKFTIWWSPVVGFFPIGTINLICLKRFGLCNFVIMKRER